MCAYVRGAYVRVCVCVCLCIGHCVITVPSSTFVGKTILSHFKYHLDLLVNLSIPNKNAARIADVLQ